MLLKLTYWKIKRKIIEKIYPNVHIGFGTVIIGKLKIVGKGKIYIGDNCRLKNVVLKCHGLVKIGNRCYLNQTTIVSKLDVDIGAFSILSDAYIVDTDFHNLYPVERHKPITKKATRKVKIGSNVWIGDNGAILKGSTIGDNTAIGSNSVVRGYIPPNCVAIGNPAKVVKEFGEQDTYRKTNCDLKS